MRKLEERKHALSLRKNLNKKDSSKTVLDYIVDNNVLEEYHNIGIYYPIGEEIDIMDLVKIYPNKNFYLPITKDEIFFVKYNQDDVLVDGLFNTKEPIGDIVERNLIDCFLIPCVAISKDNQRIGYGKGYYDRYLKGYSKTKIGICYEQSGNIDVDLMDYDLRVDFKILG